MAQILSMKQLLKQQWESFEKQYRLTEVDTSPKNVHNLRVSTRRLEAILLLANHLKSIPASEKLLSFIQEVRKAVGPLRDIQVLEMALKELHINENEHKKQTFRAFLLQRKNASKKKARQRFKKIDLTNERKRFFLIERSLREFESKKMQMQVGPQLERIVRSSVVNLYKSISKRGPGRIEEIHAIRILAKLCRYQCECLKSLTGSSILSIAVLRQLQAVTGKIQNNEVLVEMLDRFLDKKKNQHNKQVLVIRKQVCKIQSQLKRAFNRERHKSFGIKLC